MRLQKLARTEELRALGATPDDFDGPGSPRPADLARRWSIIETLDADAMAEGCSIGTLSRLVHELKGLEAYMLTSDPLFSS
jgi:hypothetical protein